MALFSIDVHIHGGASVDTLKQVLSLVEALTAKVTSMAKTLDDLVAQVEAQSTVVDSLVTLLNGIKQKLDDALSGTTLPPAVHAKVDAIFEADEATTQKMKDAILANTPEEPTP